MAVNRWHVGEARDEPLRDRLVVELFSLYDTPAGSNVAGSTWSSLLASNGLAPTVVPGWVTLDAADEVAVGNGSVFGLVERVVLSPRSMTNGERQAALNDRWVAREPIEQAEVQERLRFIGFAEADV